jgi:hypothetical protein
MSSVGLLLPNHIASFLVFLFQNYQTEHSLLLYSLCFSPTFFRSMVGRSVQNMQELFMTNIVSCIWIRDKVDLLPPVCITIEIWLCKGKCFWILSQSTFLNLCTLVGIVALFIKIFWTHIVLILNFYYCRFCRKANPNFLRSTLNPAKVWLI